MNIKKASTWLSPVLLISLLFLYGCSKESSSQDTKKNAEFLSHVDQASFYQKQGQLKASVIEARNAIQLKPQIAIPYQIIVTDLLIAGDANTAERNLYKIIELIKSKKIISQKDTLAEVKLKLAKTYFLQQKINKSLKLLNKLSFSQPENKAKANLLRADIAYTKNQFKKALVLYKKIQIASKKLEPLAAAGISESTFRLGDIASAKKIINAAVKKFPANADVWLWKARLEAKQKLYGKSEESYIKALEGIGQYDVMTFKKFKTISEFIIVLREEGKANEAFVYEQILAKSGPGQIQSSMVSAQENIRNGKLKAAKKDLKFVLSQSPGYKQSQYLLALVDFKLGNFEESEKLLTSLIKNNKFSLNAEALLAVSKMKLNHPKEAKDTLSSIKGVKNNQKLLALLGVASMAMGDIDSGTKYFEDSLRLNSGNQALRQSFANYLILNGRNKEAIQQLQAGLKIDSTNSNMKVLYLKALINSNQINKAVQLSKKWLKKSPQNLHLLDTYGSVLLVKRDFKNAKKQFLKALSIDSNHISSLLNLGNMYNLQKSYQKASEYFAKVISLDNENKAAIKGFLLSDSKNKNNIEGINALVKISKKHKNSINIKLVLAEYYAKNGDLNKSLEYAKRIQSKNVDPERISRIFMAIYETAATAKAFVKDYADAETIIHKGLQSYPNSLRLSLLDVKVKLSLGEAEKALKALTALKSHFSKSPAPYEAEGDILYSQKHYIQAAGSYALARTKKDGERLAIKQYEALTKSNKSKDTIAPLISIIKKQPESPLALLALASNYQSHNKNKKAIQTYEALLSYRPSSVTALNNLAWLYLIEKNDKAEAVSKKAYELKSNSGAIADTYGWILFKAGKLQKSIKILEKAYQLSPENKEIKDHLLKAKKSMNSK